MTQARLKLITTGDGSHSLLREDLNETYHSFHGARSESLHVFIQHGVKYVLEKFPEQQTIHVFEVGFGTGLNAFLSANYAGETGISMHFHTLEPLPVPQRIYEQLNFGSSEAEQKLLQTIHQAEWGKPVSIHEHFYLAKYKRTLEQYDPQSGPGTEKMDVIFYDAFAPSKQAEVWSLDNLQKCYELLKSGGILTTYCAQGQFKRNLAAAGFAVETLKGAMGKKEMVRGIKS